MSITASHNAYRRRALSHGPNRAHMDKRHLWYKFLAYRNLDISPFSSALLVLGVSVPQIEDDHWETQREQEKVLQASEAFP